MQTTKSQLAGERTIAEQVAAMLRMDLPENYKSSDDAIEGIISDIESSAELTPEDAATIGDCVEEWFAKESA